MRLAADDLNTCQGQSALERSQQYVGKIRAALVLSAIGGAIWAASP
jgi:gamma-glutamylcysteine synthetase